MEKVVDTVQTPMVSVCCLVYNHEPFLRECFEGFVMQKTNFPIEILVHDDASTDRSTDIIREYTANYPDLFKPIYQTENQYSKGVKVSATFQFPRAQGKYIALCEGDDYWTDPYKLQKQVDFLESHPEYVMCSHKYQIYKERDKKFEKELPSRILNSSYDLDVYISCQGWWTQVLTLVFKKSALDIIRYSRYQYAKDLSFCYHLLKSGKGYIINENMGVYRHNIGGVWVGANRVQQITSDIKAINGLCEIEGDETSAKFLLNRLMRHKYLGLSFLTNQFKLYMNSLRIIGKQLGILSVLRVLVATIIPRWK